MTTNKWKNVIDSCQEASNVTLVCCDGTLNSHKIMIAIISDFMKNLMMSIPAADSVTIYLPDFQTEKVQSVLDQFNYGNINLQFLDEDLLLAFKGSSSNEMLEEVFEEESNIEKMEEGFNDGWDSKQVFLSMSPTTSGDIEQFNPILNIKTDPDCEEKYIIEEKKEDRKPPRLSSKVRDAIESGKCPKKIDRLENKQRIQELAKKFLSNYDDTDFDFCEDDNSVRGEKKKIIMEKRMKHTAAIEAMARGECYTIAQAAKRYDVNRRTLSKLLVKGKNFQGRGKVSRVFSYEEEKIMTERILAKSNGGKSLTFDIVTEVINDELSIKKINHPEKNISEAFLRNYKYAFVRRSNLDKYIQVNVEAGMKDRRIFECEICYKKYTFKNILVSHQKKCHSAFYNNV